jgi:hypothetical protein
VVVEADETAVAAATVSHIAGRAGTAQPLLYLALAAVAGYAAARRSG